MANFLILANWKANNPPLTSFDLASNNRRFQVPAEIEVAIAPPAPFIATLPSQFTRAAQDLSSFPVGAYTGEIPATILADLGVKYCLVGHSERRKFLHETNLEIEAKMKQATQNSIIPILCAQNLEEIPANIRNFSPDKFLIMYEPFASISVAGQYHPENPEKITATITDWKNRLNLACRFLYGGSVHPQDEPLFQSLVTAHQSLVTGFVVGHASLVPETFFAIIKKCLQALPSA